MTAQMERTVTLSDSERQMALEASRYLEPFISYSDEVRVQFVGEASPSQVVSIPTSVLRLLNELLKEMAQGNTMTLFPTSEAITTQRAADLLNVSRPFLIGLLEAGKIPYQRLGSHRRILLRDLLAFKEKHDQEREEAFRSLTEEAQELDMGY